ncbi:MAG: cystathionine beta-lyase [Rhodospirillales bacterium]|nr:cystathionine beta-lyase [Rhodospirillales bacterium]
MKKETQLIAAGRHPDSNYGIVNPPVYHASTVTFKTVADMERIGRDSLNNVYYGRYGTPTTFAFEEAVATLEGGDKCIAVPSGMAAIALSLLALLKSGDHLLMVDSAYFPTRKFCDGYLKNYGVETTYYDPMIGGGISELLRPETKVVFTESPGSITFEVQDIPAISAEAHKVGAKVLLDNTWSAGLLFQPFEHGVDVSIQAATKYLVGHSDAMLGTVTTTTELYEQLKWAAVGFGYSAAPDDCYLGLRGIRSLSPRMERHQKSAQQIAEWLEKRPEVETLLHPAFESCPGHEFWKRDFTGAAGLFAISLKNYSKDAVAAMLDDMEHFALGYSWGGFESLIIPSWPKTIRTATEWKGTGPLLRLQVGLENADDLIEDLDKGFKRLNAA